MLSNIPTPPIYVSGQFQEVNHLETYPLIPKDSEVFSINNISNLSKSKRFADIVNLIDGSFELLENNKVRYYKNHADIQFLERWLLLKNVNHLFIGSVDEGDQLVCTLAFSLNELDVIWEIYFDFESVNPEHYLSVDDNGTKQYYKGNLWKILQNERRIFKGR